MDDLNIWLDEKLDDFQEPPPEEHTVICPSNKVLFDVNEEILVNISKDKLSLLSQSAFSTLKANACVYSGKYMYEIQLKSKGVMQIGFCTSQCRFTQDTGVGDTKYSYGLDGSKQRLWHVYTKKYGPFWRSGDIIGCCLNMVEGKIEYHRNGVALGEAFNNIERGPGLSLFPAVSLAFNDSLTANFGGSPFRYPVDGYKPLQNPPLKMLYQADVLLEYFVNVARFTSNFKETATTSPTDISSDSFYMLIASILIEKMIPLLINSYIVEEKVVPIIKSLCVLK